MSASPTAREHLVGILAPELPTGWKLIETARIPQTIDATTVIVNHSGIAPAPARRSTLLNTFDVYVVSSHSDKDRADLILDDAVLTLITAISDHAEVRFDTAKKVDVTDRFIGWEITLTTLTSKE